jgi:hypothetical protein
MFNLLNNNTILQNNNNFYIGFYDYKILQGYFEVGQFGYYFEWPSHILDFEPFVWYSFCLIYNAAKMSSIQFTVNDLAVFNESIKSYSEKMIYSLTSNFNSDLNFPFSGKVTDLNMWNEPLSTEDVSLFSKCKMRELLLLNIGMPIKWTEAILKFTSNETKVFNISYEELCPPKVPSKLKLFNSLMKFEEAKSVCGHLESQMQLPMDVDDFKAFSDLGNQYPMKNTCEGQIWLPIVRSPENYTRWINVYNLTEEITYLPWTDGEPNGYPFQNCVTSDNEGYSDRECDDDKCFVCNFTKSPIFHLRGPCALDTNIDSKYIFNFHLNKKGDYVFQGFAGLTDIVGNVARNSWEFVSYNLTSGQTNVIGTLSPLKELPVGYNTWKLMIPSGNDKNKTVELKLTKVVK